MRKGPPFLRPEPRTARPVDETAMAAVAELVQRLPAARGAADNASIVLISAVKIADAVAHEVVLAEGELRFEVSVGTAKGIPIADNIEALQAQKRLEHFRRQLAEAEAEVALLRSLCLDAHKYRDDLLSERQRLAQLLNSR